MNPKLERYLSGLFSGVPRTRAARELYDELAGNLQQRYDDYLREGRSESEAYSLTIASTGDVDEMLSAVMPDEAFRQEARLYRRRNARNTAIAVALYILGAAVLIACGALDEGERAVQGLVALLVLAAGATALLIYTHMSTPAEYKTDSDDEDDRWEREIRQMPGGERFRMWMSVYWSAVTAGYLLWSFLTGAWHFTWLIWPLAGILSSILRVLFLLRHEK